MAMSKERLLEFFKKVLFQGGSTQFDAHRKTGRWLDEDEYKEVLANKAKEILEEFERKNA